MSELITEPGSQLMQVAQGSFELQRNPPDKSLQAWDAADEFLLNHIAETMSPGRDSRVLVVNDSFGALAVALSDSAVFSWNDSLLSQQALRSNLLLNACPADAVQTNTGIAFPQQTVDCVVIRVPKTLALLEYQLYQLRGLLHPGSRVLAAGMSRNIHSSTLQLFETILGPTTTTRAIKKSRLIMVERDHSMNEGQSQYPEYYDLSVEREYRIGNHASLFSRDRLDKGSRFLIENMATGEAYKKIVDLGCGNGVLGIIAAAVNPDASVVFADESHMAVASAKDNFLAAFGKQRSAEFFTGDCLQDMQDESVDLVLNNPPFHQQHSNSDAIAWNMFKDARRVLRSGGELRVVGNRHLGYHGKLKKIFGNCETLAANKKYVILQAIRP